MSIHQASMIGLFTILKLKGVTAKGVSSGQASGFKHVLICERIERAMFVSKKPSLDPLYSYSPKRKAGSSDADVLDGFNFDPVDGPKSETSSRSMSGVSVKPSSSGSAVASEGSALSAHGEEMFRQATGYTMIRSSEGVSFADSNGEPPPPDKLAMLTAASKAFSTGNTNGHPLHSGISLHTDDLETSLSQIGVQASDLEMYENLMTILNKSLIS
ncbi:hypothetical protein [Rhizobium sp. BE258]|uniref:hypothetical protein n=1 Tax=Rhizobium sp. BE258 TaxID=2817722 RepID=UPI002861BCDE|nr:hypothetical protein [Rhizobium sp. BE258]MDR7147783.1 hypothetical protein [Rhizobium sp. BE258]